MEISPPQEFKTPTIKRAQSVLLQNNHSSSNNSKALGVEKCTFYEKYFPKKAQKRHFKLFCDVLTAVQYSFFFRQRSYFGVFKKLRKQQVSTWKRLLTFLTFSGKYLLPPYSQKSASPGIVTWYKRYPLKFSFICSKLMSTSLNFERHISISIVVLMTNVGHVLYLPINTAV